MKKILYVLFGFTLITSLYFPQNLAAKEYSGFFNFSYSESEDKLIIEVDKLDTEFLYVSSLASGVGSNDLGLDRGRLAGKKIVKFIKAGNKLLLIQPNYDYRGESDNPYEEKAVDDAFATSVLWGFKIEKEENGTYFIDASDFFMQDVAGLATTLKRMKEGNYKVDKTRSAFYLPNTKNFPKNSEIEVMLTFTGEPTGRYTRTVTPTPEAITVRQHHSFIELPDDNYKPRVYDPRVGFFHTSFMDYTTSFDENLTKRFINRHRLQKKDPNAKMSEAVEPIVYYVDRGMPEPIKSAVIEGASWWNQAFEAAGFKNAFIVKEMPEGADMLDIRYNVIQWVHRSTRGWSYGSSVADPRTGEILKGHVTLGSLRIRQDFMIAQGLTSPYGKDKKAVEEAREMALARIRQLSVHEVGHTLGLAHAYSSSAEGRTSVMDYPQPLIKIKDDKLDLSDAYDDKIGDWDKVFIDWGYREYKDDKSETDGMENVVQNYLKKGLSFLSDATSAGGAHPYTSQWDNGENAYDELTRMMKVREIAISNFGENTIPEGTPYSDLENVLVPIYFYPRYQITASLKVVGGLNYRYALRGDGQLITEMVSQEEQEKALDALLSVVKPESLQLPEKLLQIMPPKAMGYYRSDKENIQTKTGPTFDPLSAAEQLSDMVISGLTDPERAQRLIEYHSRDSKLPGLNYIIDKMIAESWDKEIQAGYPGEIQKVVDNVVLANLMKLASSDDASTEAKAMGWYKIQELKDLVESKYTSAKTPEAKAHYGYAVLQIEQFNLYPEKFKGAKKETVPQGAPIGMD